MGGCLLYTPDAADQKRGVGLSGRLNFTNKINISLQVARHLELQYNFKIRYDTKFEILGM